VCGRREKAAVKGPSQRFWEEYATMGRYQPEQVGKAGEKLRKKMMGKNSKSRTGGQDVRLSWWLRWS
jgi:hypothetical protein